MKKPLFGGVTFTAAQRKLDFSGLSGFDVRGLLAVVDLTASALIYAAGKPGLGYTSLNGSVLTLAFDTTELGDTDKLLVYYDNGITDRPDNAATETTLNALLNAVRAQRVETIWTDDTGTRFIRINTGGTISWTDVAGNPSSAPGAGARPDADSGTVVSRYTYKATASGTGFASGDFLDHIVVTDGDAGDLISTFWVNVTAGTKIAAPSTASITPLSPLPEGAALAAKQPNFGTAGTPSADVVTIQGIANGTPQPVVATAGTAEMGALTASGSGLNGTTYSRFYATTTTASGTIVKGNKGNVFNITAWNSDTSPVFVKLFDKAAAPTFGTDQAVWEAMVSAGQTISVNFADVGMSFGTGIAIGFSGAQGRQDATALASANKAGVSLAVK